MKKVLVDPSRGSSVNLNSASIMKVRFLSSLVIEIKIIHFRVLASDSRFGVASSSGFGDPLENLVKETLTELFGEPVNSGFGASDSGFGVPMETDSCMDDLFSDNLYNNEMPDEQLLFESNIILDSTLESNLDQYGITGSKTIQIEPDQNSNNSCSELQELDPDTNLFLFLNDHSDQAYLHLGAHHHQTVDEEHVTTQNISSPIFMVSDGINTVEMDEQLGCMEYIDHEILFSEEVESEEQNTKQTSNKEKLDKKHRKGPKPLPREEIKDEKNWKNVKRCRDYRKNKTKKIVVEKTELEKLEDLNSELKEQEKRLRQKVTKMKNMYIKLISEGRIRFG